MALEPDSFLDPLAGTGRFQTWTCLIGFAMSAVVTIALIPLIAISWWLHPAKVAPQGPGIIVAFVFLLLNDGIWFLGWRYYHGKRQQLLRHMRRVEREQEAI